MSRQFLRQVEVSLSGSSSATIRGGGPTDLRIEALIGASTLQAPNPGRVRIYNPNPQTITQFQQAEKQGGTVLLSAGYVSNYGPIYSGDLKQTLYARESPVDAYIDLFCGENQKAYDGSRVTKTLAKGWTPADKVNVALDAMKPYGITGLGLVNVDLSTPAYPRGRPFVGMARDLLRQASLAAGATWSMHNGKIDIINPDNPIPSSGPIMLNSQTGLVSFPQQTASGIIARCLINPAITVHSQVKIDEISITRAERDNGVFTGEGGQQNFDLMTAGVIAADGIYTVIFMETSLDTRGNDYYQTLTCIATKGGTPTKAQANAGADVPILAPV